MKPLTRPQQILLAVVAVLAIALIADRAGLFAGGGEEGSLRSAYADKAALLARQESMLARADAWNQAAQSAREAWSRAGSRVVHARSLDLAEEDLYERLASEIRAIGSSVNSWRALDPTPQEQERASTSVQPIELSIEFQTPSPDALYALVDKIEHMPELWAKVVSMEIDGPGVMQIENAQLDVTLRVLAVASVAESRVAHAR